MPELTDKHLQTLEGLSAEPRTQAGYVRMPGATYNDVLDMCGLVAAEVRRLRGLIAEVDQFIEARSGQSCEMDDMLDDLREVLHPE